MLRCGIFARIDCDERHNEFSVSMYRAHAISVLGDNVLGDN